MNLAGSYEEVKEKIKRERGRIWLDPAEDLDSLKKSKGAKGMRWPVVAWAESDSRELEMFLWILRCSSQSDATNVESLKVLLSTALSLYAQRFDSWYNMKRTSQILKEAEQCVKSIQTKEEYLTFTDELMLYVGRMSFWLDTLIPWNEMSTLYEWITP